MTLSTQEYQDRLKELEENTANTWLRTGVIQITDEGEENTYYIDQFDNLFYCKNYPNYGDRTGVNLY